MILSRSQSKRFQKLFNLLMFYVKDTDEGKAVRADFGAHGQDSPADLPDAMLSLVWGKEGATDILDAYVERNPDGLSRADLKEIGSWKDGTYDTFPAVRCGNDIVFVLGEYALAVRGINNEVDQMVSLPSTVKTVLVPFDGLITYGTTLSQLHVERTKALERAFEEDAAHAIAEHGLVRSARQYLKVLPDARASVERIRVEGDGVGSGAVSRAGDEPRNVVRGALSGLDWEERERVLEAHFAEHKAERNEYFRLAIDEVCSKGLPPASLAASFGRLTKQQLQTIANGIEGNLVGNVSRMSKDQIARALGDIAGAWAKDLADHVVLSGVVATENMRQFVDAGGSVLVPYEDASEGMVGMPNPIIPLLQVHRTDEGYLTWLAPEICQELASVDWEARLDEAHVLDEAIGHIERAVELRGVVARSEVLDESSLEVSHEMLEEALSKHLNEGHFSMASIAGEGAFFVHSHIDVMVRDSGSGPDMRERIIQTFIADQKRFPPRDVDALCGHDTVEGLLATYPTYRDLVAFLDEHVPEGEDEYVFADKVAHDVVSYARAIIDPSQVRDLMESGESICATAEQFTRLSELMMAVVNDVPRWSLNGWSPNEAAVLGG